MQFLKNIVARITISMPFRMRVGRFGIWLVKVGRALQVRYANWNSDFRLEVERNSHLLCDYKCKIHVSEVMTPRSNLTFTSANSQSDLQTPMIRDLFAVKGVTTVLLQPYQIEVQKAKVYSWEELLPSIEEVILRHLTA